MGTTRTFYKNSGRYPESSLYSITSLLRRCVARRAPGHAQLMQRQFGGRELSPAAQQAQFLAAFHAGRCREQVSQLLANHAHALQLDETEAADEYQKMDAWALARALDLAFCGLVHLPARIVDTRTSHLHKLDVERNQLEEIEAVVGLTTLRELRAGHNRIARVPPGLPGALKQLRTLALADNRITEVPPDISSLSKLTCVVHVTRPTRAASLTLSRVSPAFCSPRRALSYLNLHGNRLERVPPPIVWADMKRLKTLYIGGNDIPLPDHTNVHTAPQAF